MWLRHPLSYDACNDKHFPPKNLIGSMITYYSTTPMAVICRAWFLSFVLWIVFCIMRRSVLGIGAMIGIAQSGW